MAQQTIDPTGQERQDYVFAKLNAMFKEIYGGVGYQGQASRLSTQLSVAGVGNGADTSEDTLFTFSLPANTLSNVGQEVDIEAWGSVAATSATKVVKVYFGAQLVTLTYTTTQTGNWRARLRVIKQASSVQLITGEADALGATTTRVLANITNGAEVDTGAIVVKVTGTSSAATANLILANGMSVSVVN